VWEELRRLFDVENFYIAELDALRDEIQFDLEIVDGARMPKRARPAGNHITEYIIERGSRCSSATITWGR